jgi:arylsulfatase
VHDPESITDEERQEMVDIYDGEDKYTDAQVGAFLDALDERDLLEKTLVILTADHGEAFGEHGYYGHPRQLDDELLRVPLVVRGPDVPEAAVEGPVSTLDVVPTVLDAIDEDTADYGGRSLLDVAASPDGVRNRRVFSQVRGIDDESHLRRYCVRSMDSRGWVERRIEDGEITTGPTGELDEVVVAHSAERARLPDPDETNGAVARQSDLDRRLKALGYK